MVKKPKGIRIKQVDAETGQDLNGVIAYRPYQKYKPYGDLFMIISQESIRRLGSNPFITKNAFRVLMVMLGHMSPEAYVYMTQQTIADMVGIKREMVTKSIKILKELGIIETGKDLGKTKCYRINPELAWKDRLDKLDAELKVRRMSKLLKLMDYKKG